MGCKDFWYDLELVDGCAFLWMEMWIWCRAHVTTRSQPDNLRPYRDERKSAAVEQFGRFGDVWSLCLCLVAVLRVDGLMQ